MKFSFDFENYRENLAEKIKEKKQESQEKAKKFLKQAKKTDQYEIAKVLKKTSFDIEKIKENTKEAVVKNKSYETEEKDIGDLIPEDVKLYIDKERLREIKNTGFQIPPLKDFDEKRREDIILKAKDFINEITGGDFYNLDRLNTVISPLRGNHLINEEMGTVPVEKSPNIYPESCIKKLWFSSNGSEFFTPPRILVIANPFSKNFKERVMAIKKQDDSTYFHEDPSSSNRIEDYLLSDYDNIIKKALKDANDDKLGGITIEFRRSYSTNTANTKLADIADWIVDLPREKLYKIRHLEK